MLNKLGLLAGLLLLLLSTSVVYASTSNTTNDAAVADKESAGIEVMRAFTTTEVVLGDAVAIEDQTKRLIMFLMGVPLLLLLLTTGALGIAMGVYGKPVFVAHMVCAGLSMTLAMGHAVVGIVWFYPF